MVDFWKIIAAKTIVKPVERRSGSHGATICPCKKVGVIQECTIRNWCSCLVKVVRHFTSPFQLTNFGLMVTVILSIMTSHAGEKAAGYFIIFLYNLTSSQGVIRHILLCDIIKCYVVFICYSYVLPIIYEFFGFQCFSSTSTRIFIYMLIW